MAKKKKHTNRKKASSASSKPGITELSPEACLAAADQAITAEKYRDAIPFLKQARKKGIPEAEMCVRFFRAYSGRAKQLTDKGMDTEGKAMIRSAMEHVPDMENLTDADIRIIGSGFPLEEIVPIIRPMPETHPSFSELSVILAGRLFAERGWEHLKEVPESWPLKADAQPVISASRHMDAGDWEKAAAELRQIPIRSPHAQIRMFCDAMCAFLKNDNRGIRRALARMPDTFPLPQSMAALHAASEDDKTAIARLPSRTAETFYDGNRYAGACMEKLQSALSAPSRPQDIPRLIQTCAKALSPKSPQSALSDIFSVFLAKGDADTFWMQSVIGWMMELIPKKIGKMLFLQDAVLASHKPLDAAQEMYDILPRELGNAEHAAMGRSLLLLKMVKSCIEDSGELQASPSSIRSFCRHIGEKDVDPEDTEMVKFLLIRKALELDPGNRSAWDMVKLTHAHRQRPDLRKLMEPIFLEMETRFETDPAPCLALARLHQMKNANRKAESALQRAMERAPHDPRVLYQYGLSLLISADKNIAKGKKHLVTADLDRAEALSIPALGLHIAVKRTTMKILVDRESPHQAVIETLLHLSPERKIKAMCLLLLDIEGRRIPNTKALLKSMDSMLGRSIKALEAISTEQARTMTSPLPEDEAFLYAGANILDLIRKHTPNIFHFLSDEDLFVTIREWMSGSRLHLFQQECRRRECLERPAQRHILFTVLTRIFDGVWKRVPQMFDLAPLVAKLKGPDREAARAIAKSAAFLAGFDTRISLQTFQFEKPKYDDDLDEDDDFDGNVPPHIQDIMENTEVPDFVISIVTILVSIRQIIDEFEAGLRQWNRKNQGLLVDELKRFLDAIIDTGMSEQMIRESLRGEKDGGPAFAENKHVVMKYVNRLPEEMRKRFTLKQRRILY